MDESIRLELMKFRLDQLRAEHERAKRICSVERGILISEFEARYKSGERSEDLSTEIFSTPLAR